MNKNNFPTKSLQTPLTKETVSSLRAGDQILLNGTIYTARDAAHKRLVESLSKKEHLPFDVEDAVIYYVGPSPAKPGEVIGSAGPTTSYRMDAYSIPLIAQGLTGMIGKGKRNEAVIQAMKDYGCVYFTAIGGAGALISNAITAATVIAYDDLGPEAIHKLTVKDFPLIVTIDSQGNNLYDSEPKKYEIK